MQLMALLISGLLGTFVEDYSRPLDAAHLDQPTLDAESYGDKKALKREDGGLRISLAAGQEESGWKTPQALRIGGNFTITAEFSIGKLPKPAQEDGAAIGLSIAFQDLNQPDLTLLRVRETNGQEVYRPVDKGLVDPTQPQMQQMQMQMMVMANGQPGQPPKPPRRTFPASGDAVRMVLQREGNNVRLRSVDVDSGRTRYLGQVYIGPNDIAGVKLFASNRNGAEPVDVVLRNLTVRADRLTGLGTAIRTVRDAVVYGEPTAIEDDNLLVGGPSATAPNASPDNPTAAASQTVAVPANGVVGAIAVARAGGANVVVMQRLVPAVPAVPANVAVAEPPPNAPAVMPAQPSSPTPAEATPTPATPAAPKAKIPLDEIESIRFERTPAMTARFEGQSDYDYTTLHPSSKKDEPKKDEAAPKAEGSKEEPKKVEAAPKAEVKKEATATKVEVKPDAPAGKAEVKAAQVVGKVQAKAAVVIEKAEVKADETKKPGAVDGPAAPPPGTAAVVAVAPKVEPKPNGVRDLQLSLSGLRNSPIQQVTVNCQTDKGATTWQIDTTGSQAWPLVVRRSGTEGWATLFLEPPNGDVFEKDFTVAVVYQDGQSANATVKSDKHTDPHLAVDPKAPKNPNPDVWVYVAGDEKLFGKLAGLTEDAIEIATPWGGKLNVPLVRVVGFRLAQVEPKETPESFGRRLKSRGTEDLLLARTKDGEVVAIAGVLEGMEGDRFLFRYQGKTRKLPIELAEGLVMADRPEPDQPDELRSTFTLPGGVAVSGRWKGLDATSWKVETPWGQEVSLPAAEIQGVRSRGGRVTYLSDLAPAKVEEVPFFGRTYSWRRDIGLLGDPLRMDGRTFDRGVSVHSRSSLTYDLDGKYDTFEALVGFDEASRGKGRVECRVFADGKEIYANPDLRADAPPVPLKLPLAGAQQLRLLVDFGQGQDTGDRVIWANARLYRK
ncbi:NPCBM/NEW2 domain-containing protein [Tundrisphaera lichenicola]|uniref:NPCBM/NEW2 domain-containing protein n=1 Tax=Tundrisphaera lichenicola TaxID=2029860 RepID=UPI003EBFF500